ncbi:MAG: ester cyclase [Actinomycetota bacterium]|nr:ester cyclase [Actinomycetota bacterium]
MGVRGSTYVAVAGTDGSRAGLLREPLFWAAAAAFSGTTIGLLGAVRQATLGDSFYVDPAAQLLAQIPGFLGEALVMSSSLGAVYLAWNVLSRRGRRLASLGISLLALVLLAEAVGVAASVYWSTGERWQGYAAFPFPTLETSASFVMVFLPPFVLLPFGALTLLARERRLGGLLLVLFVLSLPFGALRSWLSPPEPTGMIEPTTELLASVLGWYPSGVGLPEAPLWVLLGAAFARRARSRASGEAFRTGEKRNLEAARRLYEDGLGRGDASVVDRLVSEDFRDLKRGSRGKAGMARVFSDLWRSYPDLAVSIGRQEAEDDLVRTRVVLSGTDRGGVLWYPPTGGRAAFTAEFVDRFRDGLLVEHSGEADTEELLRQLGLAEAHGSPPEAQT